MLHMGSRNNPSLPVTLLKQLDWLYNDMTFKSLRQGYVAITTSILMVLTNDLAIRVSNTESNRMAGLLKA
jgi:hypothetical protein